MLPSDPIRKVLIVDDERTITDTLVMIFSGNGYDARGVYSAEDARDLILTWSPNLAIIDVLLPEMNGIDLAILLKAMCPDCHLTLFSGHGATADLLEPALHQGYRFEVRSKPVHPSELLGWAAQYRAAGETGQVDNHATDN